MPFDERFILRETHAVDYLPDASAYVASPFDECLLLDFSISVLEDGFRFLSV